jgi:hypothetical protein
MVRIRPQSRPVDPVRAALWQATDSGPNGTAYVAVAARNGGQGLPILPTRPRASTDRSAYLRAHAHEAACGQRHTVRCGPTDHEIERLTAATLPRPGVVIGRLPNGYRKVCPRQRPACTVLGCGTSDRPLRTVKPKRRTAYPRPWLDRPVGGVGLQQLQATDVRAEAIKVARAEVTVCQQAIREIRRVMRRAETDGQLAAIGPLTRDLRIWQAKQRAANAKIKTRIAEMTAAEIARMDADAEAARNRLVLATERLEEAAAEVDDRTAIADAARADLAAQRKRSAPVGPEAEQLAAERRAKRNERDRARRAERKRTETERLAAVGINGGK